MAERRSTSPRDARVDRSDAALVAGYIHELSERHGSDAAQTAPRAGAPTDSDESPEG